MIKVVYLVFCLLLLIYLVLPGMGSINQVPALPGSVKSTLSGDTVQVPNVTAYFSNNYRDFVTNYYFRSMTSLNWFPFPPIKLNHPPEFAFQYIKDQTHSTYLEEYTYPLRDSLFVNGLEPFYFDGKPKYWGAAQFSQDGNSYDTKVTLRYYPSTLWARLIVWFGIVISLFYCWKLTKVVVRNG